MFDSILSAMEKCLTAAIITLLLWKKLYLYSFEPTTVTLLEEPEPMPGQEPVRKRRGERKGLSCVCASTKQVD